MLEMHLTCPNCEKTFVVYDWQLWRDSEENESFQCPCCHTAPDEEACYRLKDGFWSCAMLTGIGTTTKRVHRCRLKNRAGTSR